MGNVCAADLVTEVTLMLHGKPGKSVIVAKITTPEKPTCQHCSQKADYSVTET